MLDKKTQAWLDEVDAPIARGNINQMPKDNSPRSNDVAADNPAAKDDAAARAESLVTIHDGYDTPGSKRMLVRCARVAGEEVWRGGKFGVFDAAKSIRKAVEIALRVSGDK